jgi:outer membrane protein insertion porin family
MRLRALLFAFLLGAAPAEVAAQTAPTVTPIPHTPPAAQPPQLSTLSAPPDLAAFAGKAVTRVTVVLEGNIWDDVEAPAVTSLAAGDTLTPALARGSLEELLRSGRFARGRVQVQPDAGGVLVVVRVVPRKLIRRLDVDLRGARLDRDDLMREAGLADGGEIVGADLDETKGKIERFCALHGYPAARADVRTRDTDDPTRALVLVDLSPGAPRLIDERRFYVFYAKPEQVLPLTSAYPVDASARADEPALDQADGVLEQVLRAKGWSYAAVSHDLAWVGEPSRGGRVVLRVRIDAGPLLLPRFEGNAHYDDDVLTAALTLGSDVDRSPSHLADKLRAFYEKRGFLDVQVRVELRGGDKDPVQLLVFHLDERPRVRVVGRRYPCLKLDAIKHLKAGGPTSSEAIGSEIDSYLDEELPGSDLLVAPDPRALGGTIGPGNAAAATGAGPVPTDLRPDTTYVASTYEHAVEHVQELYRNEGFLHAEVGPVQVVRARCDPRSPPQRCVPLPLPAALPDACVYDSSGLPAPAEPLDPAFTCVPDPARGIECAPTADLVIPVKLGPRTRLWDVAFTGVRSVSERDIADAADVSLGDPVSTTKLEDARRRVADWYKEQGYAYVDVKYALEPSADYTRARVRFDVTEGDRVIVREIVIRGLDRTRESVVRRRIALEAGKPFRSSDVRKTQERIATLGVFSSVTVSLADPQFPQASKDVIVDVVERPGHYIEVGPGFSTGEGVRGTFEYDERNILGYAISAVFRVQLSYLPNFLILDPQVAANYEHVQDRLARRITLSGTFPDIGLGPLVRSQVDAIYVRDLERDFALDKVSGFGSLIYRPVRGVQLTVGQSVEDNNVRLFQFDSIVNYLVCNAATRGAISPGLLSLLRVPDGQSLVVAERASVAWDRRDSAFNAHRGTYVYLGAELVNSSPEGSPVQPNVTNQSNCTLAQQNQDAIQPAPQTFSHFVRLTQTIAGYIPITRNVSLAAELRLGENVRTAACTSLNPDPNHPPPAWCAYPDRLFFMGGFDSMRGWLQDTFMPQDFADTIAQNPKICTDSSTNCVIPLRGGNMMINPRLELRFPIRGPLEAALFADFGNLYFDPTYVFEHAISFRADVGPGVRVDTPVGPLVFDYGINVTRRSYEDFGAFHFAIGVF